MLGRWSLHRGAVGRHHLCTIGSAHSRARVPARRCFSSYHRGQDHEAVSALITRLDAATHTEGNDNIEVVDEAVLQDVADEAIELAGRGVFEGRRFEAIKLLAKYAKHAFHGQEDGRFFRALLGGAVSPHDGPLPHYYVGRLCFASAVSAATRSAGNAFEPELAEAIWQHIDDSSQDADLDHITQGQTHQWALAADVLRLGPPDDLADFTWLHLESCAEVFTHTSTLHESKDMSEFQRKVGGAAREQANLILNELHGTDASSDTQTSRDTLRPLLGAGSFGVENARGMNLNPLEQVLYEAVLPGSGYSADCYLPHARAVIEADGPTHFYEVLSTGEILQNGSTRLKHWCLSSGGYLVMNVPLHGPETSGRHFLVELAQEARRESKKESQWRRHLALAQQDSVDAWRTEQDAAKAAQRKRDEEKRQEAEAEAADQRDRKAAEISGQAQKQEVKQARDKEKGRQRALRRRATLGLPGDATTDECVAKEEERRARAAENEQKRALAAERKAEQKAERKADRKRERKKRTEQEKVAAASLLKLIVQRAGAECERAARDLDDEFCAVSAIEKAAEIDGGFAAISRMEAPLSEKAVSSVRVEAGEQISSRLNKRIQKLLLRPRDWLNDCIAKPLHDEHGNTYHMLGIASNGMPGGRDLELVEEAFARVKPHQLGIFRDKQGALRDLERADKHGDLELFRASTVRALALAAGTATKKGVRLIDSAPIFLQPESCVIEVGEVDHADPMLAGSEQDVLKKNHWELLVDTVFKSSHERILLLLSAIVEEVKLRETDWVLGEPNERAEISLQKEIELLLQMAISLGNDQFERWLREQLEIGIQRDRSMESSLKVLREVPEYLQNESLGNAIKQSLDFGAGASEQLEIFQQLSGGVRLVERARTPLAVETSGRAFSQFDNLQLKTAACQAQLAMEQRMGEDKGGKKKMLLLMPDYFVSPFRRLFSATSDDNWRARIAAATLNWPLESLQGFTVSETGKFVQKHEVVKKEGVFAKSKRWMGILPTDEITKAGSTLLCMRISPRTPAVVGMSLNARQGELVSCFGRTIAIGDEHGAHKLMESLRTFSPNEAINAHPHISVLKNPSPLPYPEDVAKGDAEQFFVRQQQLSQERFQDELRTEGLIGRQEKEEDENEEVLAVHLQKWPDGSARPVIRESAPRKNLGRNKPCHCGSGKKYKKCCYKSDRGNSLEASKLKSKKQDEKGQARRWEKYRGKTCPICRSGKQAEDCCGRFELS